MVRAPSAVTCMKRWVGLPACPQRQEMQAGSPRYKQPCAVVLVWLLWIPGCPPPAVKPGVPLQLHEAIGKVNRNSAGIDVCLKANAHANGYWADQTGGRRAFNSDATVLVIAPSHLYGTFKVLGSEELLLGSNADKYWLYIKRDENTYRVGTYTRLDESEASSLPIRPDMLIEALGLNPLPETTVGTAGPVQRITDDHQQLLFLAYTDEGQGIVTKEYWLDRFEPRLIRRIVFRDPMGQTIMCSQLDDYKPLTDGGPLLPGEVHVRWPLEGSELELRIRQWKRMPDRTRDHAAFVAPHQRGQSYRRMIDLDTGLPLR